MDTNARDLKNIAVLLADRHAEWHTAKTHEFAAEMRLIAVAHFNRDEPQRAAFQQQTTSFVHAALHEVSMRRHAHRLLEFAQQMKGAHPGGCCDIVEQWIHGHACIDKFPRPPERRGDPGELPP